MQPFFAKADLDRVDAFKKIVNYEHDLFDPDDPLNRRSVKIAQNLPKESKEFKAQVHDEITLAICDDLIYDRKTLLDWCETVGFEVTKITKKQISIKNPETGRPEVFKGEFYEQNFRNTAKSTELKAEASGRYRQRAEKRYQTCLERHEKLCEAKSKYHLERYGNGNRESRNGLDPKFTEPKNRNAIENRQSGEQLQQQYSGIEQGSSEADSRHEPTFADIAVIKPRNNRTSEAEKSPYFINFSPDFSATYFAYQQYVFRLYQQNKLQRTKPDQDITADRASEASRSETSFKFEQSRVTEEISANCIQGLENEFRSPTFEDHRRTAIAVEATTARTTESTRAYTSAISDYRAVKGLHEDFKREAQRSSDDRTEISADGAETIRANYLSNFFRNYARQLESTVTNTFKRFSEELGDRERSQELDQARITEYGASRDRTAIEADDRANNQENEFRRAISTKISGVNPTSIFTALDVLDQRRELEREQARKNDRGYDSPRPF